MSCSNFGIIHLGRKFEKNQKRQRFLLPEKSKRREQKRREQVRNRRPIEHSSGCALSLLLVHEGRHSQSSPLPLFSSTIKVNTAGESLLCIQIATSCWSRLCKTAVVDLKFPRVDQYPQHLPALLCACPIYPYIIRQSPPLPRLPFRVSWVT